MKRLNYFENIKLSFKLIISIDKGISINKKSEKTTSIFQHKNQYVNLLFQDLHKNQVKIQN